LGESTQQLPVSKGGVNHPARIVYPYNPLNTERSGIRIDAHLRNHAATRPGLASGKARVGDDGVRLSG
jgi:hypothetical protein